MIKSIKMAALGLLASTSAYATDLPSRTTPPLPPTPVRAAVEPAFYAGAFAGGVATDISSWSGDARVGVVAGWQPFAFARVEGTYEYGWNGNNARHSNTIFANAIGQYKIGAFTPYALVGTGYTWSTLDQAVWNVGGGVRYAIPFLRNVETDLRYRYISNYNINNHQNVITLGVNYRF